MMINCIFPDGTHCSRHTLPTKETLDKMGYHNHGWRNTGADSRGNETYILVKRENFNITFLDCVNGPITIPREAITNDSLPKAIPREGYSSSWDIPELSDCDVELHPSYAPIQYTALFFDDRDEHSKF